MSTNKRVAGNAALGAMVTPILVWWWNGFNPDLPQLSPEVAASVGSIIGVVISYAVSWLPRPGGDGRL